MVGLREAEVIQTPHIDWFTLAPELETDYADTVRALEEKYYTRVSRFTTSAFMRMKLAQVLTRAVQPHVFESKGEAQRFHDVRR